jgi:hypothetical protein
MATQLVPRIGARRSPVGQRCFRAVLTACAACLAVSQAIHPPEAPAQASPLTIQPETGRVGVGTSVPEAKLHVSEGSVLARLSLNATTASSAPDGYPLGMSTMPVSNAANWPYTGAWEGAMVFTVLDVSGADPAKRVGYQVLTVYRNSADTFLYQRRTGGNNAWGPWVLWR